ncbi:MAG: VOC family protein [Litorivicinaceae bacterium]|nr:VOC family protein [Litorivicinaceae bacterium]
MLLGIRHFGIVVLDIERSLYFYKKYFGFKVEKDADEQGSFIEQILSINGAHLRTVKLLSPVSEVMIELVQYFAGGVVENDNAINQVGPTHFAITVGNIDKLYAQMTSENVQFLSKPTNSPDNYARVAFCRAPEGTYIEMVELLSGK